jgi:hypothetical protein
MSVRRSSEPRPGSIDQAFGVRPRPHSPPIISLRTSLRQIEPGRMYIGFTLTESSLVDLFCREGKHRKYFGHDFNDDACHDRGGRNVGINFKTFEETR